MNDRIPELNAFRKDICIGCGVCAHKCNKNLLEIKKKNGFYMPIFTEGKCNLCNICVKNCIFNDKNVVSYKEPSKAFIGFDNNENDRVNSASGGLLTQICKYMLKNSFIDGVVTVKFQNGKFVYYIAKSIEELDSSRGSVYMPVYYNNIWEKILEFNGKLVFLGTPCWCEVIFKLRNKDIRYKKIQYIFALVCGHMPSEISTINFFEKKNIKVKLDEIKDFRYRGNGWPGGGYIKTMTNQTYYFNHTDIWDYKNLSSLSSYNNACLICNDLWGSYADASFADYWNSELIKEGKGYNLALLNNIKIEKLLNEMHQRAKITIQEIDLKTAFESQKVPLYIKKNFNADNRKLIFNDLINTKNYRYIKSKIILFLVMQLRKRNYKTLMWNLLNEITWKIVMRGVKKNENNIN
jgi:coenzyme F420-reducing hydrogenase beta subunit